MAKAKQKLLTIRAGQTARQALCERGFEPDMFSTLVGASGGPKWLVLSQLNRVLLISPSKEFIETLPGARIPDRNDFETQGTEERQRNWNGVVDVCRALADELHELIATGSLADEIEPF